MTEGAVDDRRSVPARPPSPVDPPLPAVSRRLPLFRLLCLFAVSFSYGLAFNALSNIVIPKEIERLAASRQSVWVGLIMAAGAFSQMATPVVGAWSDRTAQRTPYLVYGTLATTGGIALFIMAASAFAMPLLFAAHVLTTVGLSTQYAMVTALLNDHVADEQVGAGSGALAILAILGSGAGYTMFALDVPLTYSYLSYIIAAVLCLGVTLLATPETPLKPPPRQRKQPTGCCAVAASALSVPSLRRNPDFFFACVGRGLFNTGLGGQVYLVYYFRDVLLVDNPTRVASTVAVMALVGGIVGALPAGLASDRVGKKPVIYWSIVACAACLVLFLLARDVAMLQLVGFGYGLGNVAYLSVDYALGVQALPKRKLNCSDDDDEEEDVPEDPTTPKADARAADVAHGVVPANAAKDLGVFAMSATVGQLAGQVIYGAVLEQFAFTTPTGVVRYTHTGFVAVFSTAAAAFLAAGVVTRFIRGVR